MSKGRKFVGQETPPQEQIDISKTETIQCEECNNASFIQTFFLKRMSALMSPTGKEAIIPIQAFGCDSCGHINKEFQEADIQQQ